MLIILLLLFSLRASLSLSVSVLLDFERDGRRKMSAKSVLELQRLFQSGSQYVHLKRGMYGTARERERERERK